jgi:hypothetical protein
LSPVLEQKLPSLRAHDDEDVCHIVIEGEVFNICGVSVSGRSHGHVNGTEDFSLPCPDCRRPICQRCARIVLLFLREGVWEGYGDPTKASGGLTHENAGRRSCAEIARTKPGQDEPGGAE